MHILVTGGAGFIGSHLADALLAAGHRVRAYDSLEPQVHGEARQRPAYLDERVELITGDIRDKEALAAALEGIDAIFHFAAMVGVGQSQYEIERYTDVNVRGTATLLDLLANTQHGVKKIVVASSMSIYGEGLYVDEQGQPVTVATRTLDQLAAGQFDIPGVRPVPTPEWKPLQSESIYALNKRDQEEYVLLFGRTYGVPCVALRFFNTYGSRQALSNPYTGAAAIFISRLRRNLVPLIYEDGHQMRDFVDVRDVARACVLALESDRANNRVFNVGSGTPISILGIAKLLAKIASLEIEPEVVRKYRKGDIRHCFADISAIRELGFEPKYSLEQGLEDLYAWTVEQEIAATNDVDADLNRRKLLV